MSESIDIDFEALRRREREQAPVNHAISEMQQEYARELADEGMQRTLEAEREEWIAAAIEGLKRFAALPGWHEFKTEDFRAWFGRQPHSHKVWGALTNRACKEGILEWTGRYAPSVSPKTHGHPVKVWRLSFSLSLSPAGMPRASLQINERPMAPSVGASRAEA